MKTKHISLIVILLLSPILHASTVVEPILSGAVTWTREGSPYQIFKDTRLVPGSNLVIYPGVTLEVSAEPDASIQGGTPLVDLIIQGDLQIMGNDFAPVSIVSDRPMGKWGALYLMPPVPQEWASLYVIGGQLILGQGALKMNYCGILRGRGVVLMPGAQLNLEECQLDENSVGLMFMDRTASVTMNKTRLRRNEVGILFRAPAALQATECGVYDSRKFHAANMTAEPIAIPSMWWGTDNGRKIMKRVFDGRKKKGYGLFQFATQLRKDPMILRVKGFDPGKDPSRRRGEGARFLAGPLFQVILPNLNIPTADLKTSLGFGAQGGFVLPKDMEVRGTFQTAAFSATDPEARSSLHLTFLRFGLLGRKQIPLGKARRTFLFAQGGAHLGLTQQDLTRPRDPWDVTSPPINRKINETNLNPTVGLGGEFQIGRHRVELGVHYEMVPLNDDRGGSFLIVQGGLNLYF